MPPTVAITVASEAPRAFVDGELAGWDASVGAPLQMLAPLLVGLLILRKFNKLSAFTTNGPETHDA